MKRVFRIICTLVLSLLVVFPSCNAFLMYGPTEYQANATYIITAIILSAVLTLIWELYLSTKSRMIELTKRIEELEEHAKRTD